MIVIAVWLLLRSRSKTRHGPDGGAEVSASSVVAPGPDGGEEIPAFSVVALGPRGSGKTLLLTSMYHEMHTFSGRSYYLIAPFDQVLLLNQWYTEVADTGRDWPSGSAVADTRTFSFTVQTRTASGKDLPVLALEYLEYAGGLLTDPQAPGSTAQSDLVARIESAQALIGIIDGHRIRQLLDGNPEGKVRLQQTMTAMINLVMRVEKPITFVITKWDLLRDIDADENARLLTVRKALMFNQGFRDLVQTHSARRVVRLVPVSAVGPVFAELDPNGVISKLPDGEMYPTNVDVPLAAVVPDVFEQVERSITQKEIQAAMERARRRTQLGPAAALVELGSFVARAAGRMLVGFGPQSAFLGDAAAALLGSRDGDDAIDRRLKIDRHLTEAQRELEEFHLARRRVLREFQSRVDVLEGRLPSSRLSGED
jgi:hypothetical protein